MVSGSSLELAIMIGSQSICILWNEAVKYHDRSMSVLASQSLYEIQTGCNKTMTLLKYRMP